jgi:hypothetical protein
VDLFAVEPGNPKSSGEVNELLTNVFNYSFNSDDKLVGPDGSPYTFNEEDYEPIAQLSSLYIQALMRERLGLRELFLPESSDIKTNIFVSDDWTTSTQPGLVIIQGAGGCRVGQWSRKLCVNFDLSVGSCLPYIAQAQQLGWSVILFNPNLNSSGGRPIPQHSTPLEHCSTVWRDYVARPPRKLFILAHSCGGICTVHLLSVFKAPFMKRVKGIALTDSVHKDLTKLTREQLNWLGRFAVNWKASSKKPNAFLSAGSASRNGCENRSAGHSEHEWTSYSATSSVWEFFSQR